MPASLALKISQINTNYGYEAKTLQITSLCRKLRGCDIQKTVRRAGYFFLVNYFSLSWELWILSRSYCLPSSAIQTSETIGEIRIKEVLELRAHNYIKYVSSHEEILCGTSQFAGRVCDQVDYGWLSMWDNDVRCLHTAYQNFHLNKCIILNPRSHIKDVPERNVKYF